MAGGLICETTWDALSEANRACRAYEPYGVMRPVPHRVLRRCGEMLDETMSERIKHLRGRDLRFLGLVAVTALTIALYLDTGLRLAGQMGSGWRTLDLGALQRRIESGELREREADWYHPSTKEEMRGVGGIVP